MDDQLHPVDADVQISFDDMLEFSKFIGLERIASGRVSYLLMFELYCHTFMPGAASIAPKVVAELEALEGIGSVQGTKDAEQFRHLPLRGLWKTHYLRHGGEAVSSNLSLELKRQDKQFEAFIRNVIQSYPEDQTIEQKEEIAARIANYVAHDLYVGRKARGALTGEWIVFAKHQGANYYLTLAVHDEGDAVISPHRRWMPWAVPLP